MMVLPIDTMPPGALSEVAKSRAGEGESDRKRASVTKRAAARGEVRITGNGRDRRVCDGRFRKG